ncbi:ribonuclease HII [Viridibacillus sp. FSL R5-0477]|uniref:Ribonuclease HII n=1 Tax=Viridibacillus arenosi FSL R5-213 TaxID=1227360 RepID=W4EZ01_9BACL|nr:ribonuclease HII [Viridibacillus arenosi]ETT85838.1 ribonuclease HII [Viridibacillus arenosi FSL R5-213]OMC93456.1 ribonuclease HII [Viridibacillus arenosi]
MKTIKDIKEALNNEQQYQSWMVEIEADERLGVQKAWQQWLRKKTKLDKLLAEYQAKLEFDNAYRPHPTASIAGTDEAGRGPLAGPVVTAAVILPKDCPELVGLNDSKQLSKETREAFFSKIMECAIATSIHFQPEEVIDNLNIYEATKQSMKASIETLQVKPDFVLADAMTLPIDIPQDSIIKGDAKSLAIAAASILAKTARDHYMEEMDEKYPQYGFAQHAGYGTKQHLEALREFGPTDIHRTTFEPIKSMILKKG